MHIYASICERPRCWERLKVKEKGSGKWMRWLDNTTGSMDMNLNKLWQIVEHRGACSAAVHGVAKRWTQLSN